MSATQKTNSPPGGGAGPSTSSSTSLIPREPPPPHRRSRLLTWAAFILIFMVVLVIAGAFMIYGFVRPKGMNFRVDDAYVHELNFTGCCHSESINAVYNITMRAENDNKKVRILYDHVRMFIECHGQRLASSFNVGLTEQAPLDVTHIPQKLESLNVPLKDCKGDSLPKRQQGNMTIDIILKAKISFRPKNWMLDGRTIKVLCRHVNAYLPGGHPTFQPTTCNVEL